MRVIFIHGMGRTPLSMSLLAARLKFAGYKVGFFTYTVTFERWNDCVSRLRNLFQHTSKDDRYCVVAHSLGTVLTRAVIAKIDKKPEACFFLAPPVQACQAARQLASRRWFRLMTGEMGQLLANNEFMSTLPIPDMPTVIYSGDGGMTGNYSPFKDEPNDGILMVKETLIPGIEVQRSPSLHTFIMNNRQVANDIIQRLNSINDSR
ncbi:MAG: alpha/beta hydrolase [Methylococcaceae bacterium]|nr:alpha/beta hydrolase [Methylococcaceae bacterium]